MARTSQPVSTPAAYGLALFTMVIWGSAFAGIRFVRAELDWVTLTMLRLAFAAGALLVAGKVVGTPFPDRRDWLKILGAGILGFTLYHLALNYGMGKLTAGQGAFVISTIPIWTSLLAWQFLDERITIRTWLGMLLGLTGVGIISLNFERLTVQPETFVVLFAAACVGANIVLQKDLLKRYRAVDVAVYATTVGAIPLLLWLPWSIDPLSDLSRARWATIAYLGLGPIALGYFLYQVTLNALDASKASQMQLLIPPIAALIAWFAIDEEPGLRLLIGGPVILIGVLLGNLERTQK